MYLAISIYFEKEKDYKGQYVKCIATIIDKDIESEDYIEKRGLNVFSHKKKFRIKLFYEYVVKNLKYTGYFYNDGNNDKFLFESDYIPLGNTYNYVKKINIFYNKKNNKESYKNLNVIKKNKKKVYYALVIFCIILLFIMTFI
jgi:hypothetical protein